MATYNCSESANNAYGAGDFGTCEATAAVGAPNTGFFQEIVSGGSFTVLAPLAAAIIVVIIASIVMRLRKKSPQA